MIADMDMGVMMKGTEAMVEGMGAMEEDTEEDMEVDMVDTDGEGGMAIQEVGKNKSYIATKEREEVGK